MSERFTAVTKPVRGPMEYGRLSRADSIAAYRAYYVQQIAEAQAALAVPDDELVVETFLGPWAMRKREVVA